MYSRFNISTGAFISLKKPLKLRKLHTTSEYVFATSGLRTNVKRYKKYTLNPVQFQSSFLCINASVEQDLLVMTDSPVSKDQLTTNEHLKVFFTRPICSV